jgi:hippurate hydrolase
MAAKIGAGTDIRILNFCPAVINDTCLYEIAKAQGARELDEPQLVSEDFAYFADIAPSLLMLLGTGTGIPLHGDTFDFDEEVLARGVEFAVKMIEAI